MKISVRLLKITPIVLTLYVAIVMLLSLLNIEIVILDRVFGHSIFMDVLLFHFSKRFKFCAWHRILIINLLLQAIIQIIDVWSDFTIEYIIIIMVSSVILLGSSILSTILYFKYGCCKIEESK